MVDIWQTPSYSAIEYGGRWKMVQYAAKRSYSPLLVSGYVYPIQDGLQAQFGVYIVSDQLDEINGTLIIHLCRWSDGSILNNISVPFNLSSLMSQRIYVTTVAQLIDQICQDTTDCFAHLSVVDSHQRLIVANVVYLTSLIHVQLNQPIINITVLSSSSSSSSTFRSPDLVNSISLIISSSLPSPYTWLEVSLPGYWSDNGMFLIPSLSPLSTVTFTGYQPFDPQIFQQQLIVRTVYDTYHRTSQNR